MLNKETIVETLKKHLHEDLVWKDRNSNEVWAEGYQFELKEFNEVSENEGGEYQKLASDAIIAITDRNIENGEVTYWRVPGWYQSYNGTEFEIDKTEEVVWGKITTDAWVPKNNN
jgi:hypothetical protein